MLAETFMSILWNIVIYYCKINYPKPSLLKQQKFRVRNSNSSVGWFWLWVSQKVVAKTLAVATRLVQGGKVCSQDGSFTWSLVGDPSYLQCRPFYRTAWVSSWHGSCLSQSEWSKKELGGSHDIRYDLSSEVTICHLGIIVHRPSLFNVEGGGESRGPSWRLATTKYN